MRFRLGPIVVLALLAVTVPASVTLASIAVPLHWSAGDVRLAPAPDGRTVVSLRGGVAASPAGYPDLPWVVVEVPLPDPQQVVRSWNWTPDPRQELQRGLVPVPAVLDRPQSDGGPVRPSPDPAVYGGADPWPGEAVLFRGVQVAGGRALACFLISPFAWDPAGGVLSWSSGGILTVDHAGGTSESSVALPKRPVAGEAEKSGGLPPGGRILHSLKGGLERGPRPSLDSPPVEYVVISPAEFADAWAPYVDWKNRTGTPAALRTVEEIEAMYRHGVDRAERIRLFLQEAYALWGTRIALIGADPEYVPIRYGLTRYFNPTAIPTDFYYACLDGNWNGDGDQNWGEAADTTKGSTVDLRPELQVGRVSAATVEDVTVWVGKYLEYAKTPSTDPGYLDIGAIYGEVLFPSDYSPGDGVQYDGAVDCIAVADSVDASPFGDFYGFDEYYERWEFWSDSLGRTIKPLTKSTVMASLDAGSNLVVHMGHGDRDRWAIGSGRVLTSDLRGADNGPRWGGMAFVVNCNSAAVDADCMGEAFQFSRSGGGINYLGSTTLDFPYAARRFQDSFLHRWMGDLTMTPGEAWLQTAHEIAPLVPPGIDNAYRFLLYGLITLGDPQLNFWKGSPRALQVTAPATFSPGGAPYSVLVRNALGEPLEGARVTLYKEEDALASGLTGPDGHVEVPFEPYGTGTFHVTVTHPLELPYERTASVVGGATAYVTMSDYAVTDDGSGGTRGNGNGRIEAGETVGIDLTYANRGSVAAQGVNATLRLAAAVPGFAVTMLDSTETIAEVPGSGTGTLPQAFLMTVDKAPVIPAGTLAHAPIPLELTWEAGTASAVQELRPEAARPDLELIRTELVELEGDGDLLPENNELIALNVELYNKGTGTWSQLRGRLVPTIVGAVEMVDSLGGYPPLLPASSTMPGQSLVFRVKQAQGLSLNYVLEDTLTASPQLVLARKLMIRQKPSYPPETVSTTSLPGAISLEWQTPLYAGPHTRLWGYAVYRSTAEEGPFSRIGTGYIKDVRIFRDENVADTDRFWYAAAAIDSSGMEGPWSAPILGVPAPPMLAGWPNDIADSRDACPTIEDLNGWGGMEVVVLSDIVYAYNADGSDYYDGDHDPHSIGRLTPMLEQTQYFQGKAAVCDLDGDGVSEIIAAATNGYLGDWNPAAALCVFDHLGGLIDSAPLSRRPVTSAMAVGNIDLDAGYEIVFLSGGNLWAFDWDAAQKELKPFRPGTDGTLLRISVNPSGPPYVDWQLSSPALADVDGDGMDEIIFVSSPGGGDSSASKLWVVNGVETQGGQSLYGTNVNGFPYTFASAPGEAAPDQITQSSPAVADILASADGPEILVLTQNFIWMFTTREPQKYVWHKRILQIWGGGDNPLTPSPAIGDVNGDGSLEIVFGGNKGRLYVLDSLGQPLAGFDDPVEGAGVTRSKDLGNLGARVGCAILADVNGELVDTPTGLKRLPEIIVGDDYGKVWAFRFDGGPVPGFPYSVGAGKVGIGLAAWDVDRDGHQNLVIQADKLQDIRVLDFPACPFPDMGDVAAQRAANPWPQFRHDARNTGFFANDFVIPVLTLNLEGSVGEGTAVQIRWRTDIGASVFTAARMESPDGEWESLGEWLSGELADGPGAFRLEDAVPHAGNWTYRIEGRDASGEVVLSGSVEVRVGVPTAFRLLPAQPNPGRLWTVLRLELPAAAAAELRILDVTGRTVRRLAAARLEAGVHAFEWDGRDDGGRALGSGVYFAKASAAGQPEQTRKLVLMQ